MALNEAKRQDRSKERLPLTPLFESQRGAPAIENLRWKPSESLHARHRHAGCREGVAKARTAQREHSFFLGPAHVGTAQDLQQKERVAPVGLHKDHLATRAQPSMESADRLGQSVKMVQKKEADDRIESSWPNGGLIEPVEIRRDKSAAASHRIRELLEFCAQLLKEGVGEIESNELAREIAEDMEREASCATPDLQHASR